MFNVSAFMIECHISRNSYIYDKQQYFNLKKNIMITISLQYIVCNNLTILS